MNEKASRLLKDTLIFAIGSLGSKLILFFMVPLYTNYLSTAEYGTADLVFTISQLMIPLVSVTIYNGVLRYGLSKDVDKKKVLTAGVIITVIGGLIATFITPFFSLYRPVAEWKWYLCIFVVFSIFNQLQLNYLKVLNKNRTFALISLIQTAVLAISNVFLIAIYRIGIKGYIISNIISVGTSSIISFICGGFTKKENYGKFDWQLTKLMIAYSAPIIINDIAWWVIHSSDKIMIDLLISAEALGLYTVATKIPSLINVFISIFSQSWGISSIKEIETSNDTSFYSEVFEKYSTLVFGTSVLIITFIKPFMQIYVGDEFNNAWMFTPLLLASATFSAISTYFGSLYGALKKNTHSMYTTLFAAAINIVVNYFGIMIFGVWGALVGTVTAYVLIANIRMIDVIRYIPLSIRWRKYILNCALILIIAVFSSISKSSFILSIFVLLGFVLINKKNILSIAKNLVNMLRGV